MKLRIQRDGRELDFAGAEPFGKGGEASVFLVPTTAWAAKTYHQYVSSRGDKLRVMLANPPEDPTANQGHVSIAWPQDLLLDLQGRIAGYVMPLVKGMRPLADFYHPKTRREVCPLFHYFYLAVTAQNLATAVRALHRRGYVLGDVNESNILVAETAMVTLVDTDSFQVKEPGSGKVHRCIVGSEFYTPREMQGVNFAAVERREEHDLFGLGVLLFQLLMEGSHPFQIRFAGTGEPPPLVELIRDGRFPHDTGSAMWQAPPLAPPFGMLDNRLRSLFTRCFVNGHRDPQARPTADEWRADLVDAVAALISCKVNPSHRYWPHAKTCPWCDRTAKLGGRDPFPSSDQVKSGRHLAPLSKSRQAAQIPRPRQRVQTARPPSPPAPPPRTQAVPTSVPQRPAPSPRRKAARKSSLTQMVMRMLGVGTLVVGLIGLGAWGLRMSAVFSPKGIGRQTVPAGREPAGADVTASGVDARTGLVPPTAKVVADLAVAKAGDLRAVDLGAGIKLELRAIPEGKFTMGSPLDGPQHEVKLTGLFWLGRTEVTQGQWQSVMGTNPSNFRGKDLPVENVSYNDAALFCRELNTKTLLPTGWRFKLPSEAQWEYACRAGTTAEDAGDVNPSAWYSANSGSKTHGVGTKNANAWGLHDMRGNVWEWCADWYGAYPAEAQTNPSGPDEGAYRVYRGGAWGDPSMRCRSTNRDKRAPDDIQGSIGFRVAVVPTTAAFGRKAVPPGR